MFILMRRSRHTTDVECIGKLNDNLILPMLKGDPNFEYYTEPAIEYGGPFLELDPEDQRIMAGMLMAFNSDIEIAYLYLNSLSRDKLNNLFQTPQDPAHVAHMITAGLANNPNNPFEVYLLKHLSECLERIIHANKNVPSPPDDNRRGDDQSEAA